MTADRFHEYGPHDPETMRGMVEVYPPGPYTDPELRPIAPGLLRQWKALNDLAHERSRQHARTRMSD